MTNTKYWIGQAFAWISITVGVAGVALFAYQLAFPSSYSSRTQERLIVSPKDAVEVTMEGDTSRRIYVIQDSTNGMVWVGISGRTQR